MAQATSNGAEDAVQPLVRLAHAIAEDLIRQGCSKMDSSLARALQDIGRTTGVDRCLLIQCGGELLGPLRLTHEWTSDGLVSSSDLSADAAATFPWIAAHMQRRETVQVDSVEELAARDAEGADELRRHDFASLLALPMWREDTFWGCLLLVSVRREMHFDEETVELLGRVVSMLAGALEHQRVTSDLENRTLVLEEFGNRLWQLHHVQTRSYQDPAALLKAYLEAGCAMFSLSTGIVSRIEKEVYTLKAVITDLPVLEEGMTFAVGDTYCAEVVRTGKTVAYHHAAVLPGMLSHPVYVGLGLESYISTPIMVRGGLYGTLNFSSVVPRPAAFSLQDREMLELMAESIGRFIEFRDMEAERDRLIRECREAEKERRDLLERTEALSSLAVLAAGVAHEINNPLQGMLAHVQALEDFLPDDPACRKSVNMVDQGIRTIADIVQQLLALSAEAGHSGGKADGASAVGYVCQLLRPNLTRAGVRIQNRVAEGGARLALEQHELIQVLTNLMLNARDAMPKGGVITLDAEEEEALTVLRVRDTGTGIDPALRTQIFAPFFTTKGRKGTGLGLSVAESIVRQSGGEIEADSELGKGSVFVLRLPHDEAKQV